MTNRPERSPPVIKPNNNADISTVSGELLDGSCGGQAPADQLGMVNLRREAVACRVSMHGTSQGGSCGQGLCKMRQDEVREEGSCPSSKPQGDLSGGL